jgi:hypothetical protein
MTKLECCALAAKTGSKLVSASLSKIHRLCMFEPGTYFLGAWTGNCHLSKGHALQNVNLCHGLVAKGYGGVCGAVSIST